jgi:GNAT superfamily N-acetyltransferase
MTAMEIRLSRPEEHVEIGELTFDAYNGDGLLASAASPYGAVLRDAARRAADADLYVAVDDGAVLGTVTYVGGPGPMREIAQDSEAEFRMLAVAQAARGRGVGAALTAHIIDLARAGGLQRLVCSSQRGMHAAHHVYESAGFVRLPERDWSPLPGVQLISFMLDL